MTNPMIEDFFGSLFEKNGSKNGKSVPSGTEISSAFIGNREVSVNSNHAAFEFFKDLSRSKKESLNERNKKRSCKNREPLSESSIMECSCGRHIRRPEKNLSVYCSCGKTHKI